MNLNKLILAAFALSVSLPSLADKPERYYQEKWCTARPDFVALEYVLPDQSRVDCLLTNHAIEVDFYRNWAEAYGQAMFYAAITERKPGIVLIVDSSITAIKALFRLRTAIGYDGREVDLFLIRSEEDES